MTETSPDCCSSRISKLMVEGIQEIVGRAELDAVFNLAGSIRQSRSSTPKNQFDENPQADLSAIELALEERFGPRGGRGLALRSGRAAFTHILRRYGASMGISSLNFRLLPVRKRMRAGLEALARLQTDLGSAVVTIRDQDGCWYWEMENCAFCWDRSEPEPVCAFMVGLLQEFLTWTNGGKAYCVYEVECQAVKNPTCVIRIEKTPLD